MLIAKQYSFITEKNVYLSDSLSESAFSSSFLIGEMTAPSEKFWFTEENRTVSTNLGSGCCSTYKFSELTIRK